MTGADLPRRRRHHRRLRDAGVATSEHAMTTRCCVRRLLVDGATARRRRAARRCTTGRRRRRAVAQAGAEDVDRAVRAAHAASRAAVAPDPQPRARQLLRRIADAVREQTERLAGWSRATPASPSPRPGARSAPSPACFEYYAGAVDKVAGQTMPVDGRRPACTFREPLGVCALITPWNFPLLIAELEGGAGAGDGQHRGGQAGLADAPHRPGAGELPSMRAARRACVNVVTGPGRRGRRRPGAPPAGAQGAFTGSTEVGRGIMQPAAEGIKRVSLELGGKSANLVFADADLDDAVDPRSGRPSTTPARTAARAAAMFVQRPSSTSSSPASPRRAARHAARRPRSTTAPRWAR